MASNDTLTFYFCFEMPNINYFKNIRVQHSVCVVCRLEDAEPRLQTTVRQSRVRKFYAAYTGVVETICMQSVVFTSVSHQV